VLLETNGSCDVGAVDERCVRIMDLKCPGSGEEGKNDYSNLSKLSEKDELKFVISDRRDYEYAKGVMAENRIRPKNIYLSPVFGRLDAAELAGWIKQDRPGARLQLQLQKIIWDPDQRGV
jgi:7-carboxy-7-deazaguanine synthase